ncbi:MAG: hypothetical protein K8T89_14165, partial [Planctomycetes bacterium]|nr:hypothetical protein [Planctomycetota bacterium]
LVLYIGGRSRFFQDPGTFWHTEFGHRIANEGPFHTDPYTFTFAGQTYILYQWLGEVVFFQVYQHLGGYTGLLVGTVTLLAGLFSWLGSRLLRCGLHPVLVFVLVGITVAASSGHFHVRPHLSTMVGMAILFVLLADIDMGRRSLCSLWWLVPLFWIWSNVHGGVLGGFATFGLAVAGWTVFWLLGWHSPIKSWKQVGQLALIGLLSAGLFCANPYGWRLPESWIRIYQMKSLPLLIKEHTPMNLAEMNSWMVLLCAAVYVGVFASVRPLRPRVAWLLPLVWLLLTIERVRHAPLFAIGALVLLVDLFPRTRIVTAWQARGSDLFVPPTQPSIRPWAAWVIPGVLVLTAFALARLEVPQQFDLAARLDPNFWPVDLNDELNNLRGPHPDGVHLFNDYALGAYVIMHARNCRVFVDDRCELFGDAFLTEFILKSRTDPAAYINKWQKQYGQFDAALVYIGDDGFEPYFAKSDQWELVKRGQCAALFRRK